MAPTAKKTGTSNEFDQIVHWFCATTVYHVLCIHVHRCGLSIIPYSRRHKLGAKNFLDSHNCCHTNVDDSLQLDQRNFFVFFFTVLDDNCHTYIEGNRVRKMFDDLNPMLWKVKIATTMFKAWQQHNTKKPHKVTHYEHYMLKYQGVADHLAISQNW